MKRLSWLLIISALVGLLSLASCKKTNRGDLNSSIEQAISMLEAKQYKEFLQEFFNPEEMANALKRQSLDNLAGEFSKSKAGLLLGVLKRIKGRQPQYSSDQTEARFSLASDTDLPVDPDPTARDINYIAFKKVNGVWYIKNR
ncbi:MAG TPA: hypothetical protein VF791_07385 [Pyrinomonadaceae bacterium]